MVSGRVLVAAGAACAMGMLTTSRTATAQDASSSTMAESISGATANPARNLYLNGVCPTCTATDESSNTRPQNLNPEGVNYSDCAQNLRLDFSLALSGFAGSDEARVETWAGTVDCTQDENRTTAYGVPHPCWQVAAFSNIVEASSETLHVSVYARDVLRYSAPPATSGPQPYEPGYNDSSAGANACLVQTTDAAVAIGVYFIPVQPANEHAIGIAYEYGLTTDLVAPAPPSVGTLQSGDTLITVNWTSVTDPDVYGFAVYSDPPAPNSGTGGSGCGCGNTVGSNPTGAVGDGAVGGGEDATTGGRCTMDASTEPPIDAACTGDECRADTGIADADDLEASSVEASLEASVDASASAEAGIDAGSGGKTADAGVADAGNSGSGGGVNCNPVNMSDGGGGGGCVDPALTNQDVFTVGYVAPVVTEASADSGDDAGAEVPTSGGGISNVSSKYLASELDSPTATSLTLSGLTNGKTYHVVMATLDGSGNIGPVSPLQCTAPGAVSDFWQTYKNDGGGSVGCALDRRVDAQTGSVVALGALVAAAMMRRRRRR